MPPHRASSRPIASAAQQRGAALTVFAVGGAVFWRTAYPTITWWESSSYPLAARTLGIAGQPGSLLLTLLGWPVANLPIGSSPAHLVNLLAGVLAAIAATLVYVTAIGLQRTADQTGVGTRGVSASAIGAALGALTFAFSDTLWDYATKFTPYVLTAVFTGLILWAMLRWWDEADGPDAWRRLAMLGLLFGLDFSVHRTNAVLLPGALVWILLRNPRTLRGPRAWVAGGCGLVAGLAVQLLVIPISASSRSPLDFIVPNNWTRFWDYVTLKQLGGGFLFAVYPRKSSIWSVQTADFLRMLGANLFHWTGPAGILGVLPALAAIIGLAMLWRRNGRLATALTLVLVLQAAATILYFNIPPNYFRSFDRHYLPVCVTIAVLVAYGMSVAMEQASELLRARRRIAATLVGTLAVLVPAGQVFGNWSERDASNRWFARDYAANALEGLPRNAVYFTVGDNDTFPVMYLQSVEGVRPDVTILNLSVANLPDYADRRRRRDPSFPVSLTTDERRALSMRPWTDSTLVLGVDGPADRFGLPDETRLPASVTLGVRPQTKPRMLPAEITVFDIVRTNRWRRPITFAITGGSSALSWLEPYARLEGLYWRIVPIRDAGPDIERLRARLLKDAQLRGYADPAVRIDDVARTMAFQYYNAAAVLFDAEKLRGAEDRCRADMRALFAALPPERLTMPADYWQTIASRCGAGG